jgi:hypothetical protein
MKSRPTQFGARENTASSRQHASRLTMPDIQSQSSEPPLPARRSDSSAGQALLRPKNGTTVKETIIGPQTCIEPPQKQAVEHYVGAAEAAQFLFLHPRTLTQMARQGDVPAHPLGDGQRRVWRFLLSELDWWMRNRVDSPCRPCSPNRRES